MLPFQGTKEFDLRTFAKGKPRNRESEAKESGAADEDEQASDSLPAAGEIIETAENQISAGQVGWYGSVHSRAPERLIHSSIDSLSDAGSSDGNRISSDSMES